jgi:hypothetical protein
MVMELASRMEALRFLAPDRSVKFTGGLNMQVNG